MHISPGLTRDSQRLTNEIDWINLVFMLIVHGVAVLGGLWYILHHDLAPLHWALWLGGFGITTLAISAGYHRLFAHRTYETGSLLKAVWLFFGASAFQTSALRWARKHRVHHQHLDTTFDPYDATRGLWYSHMGWILLKGRVDVVDAQDLTADRLVEFQDRHYVVVAALSGFVLPAAIGYACGDLWGGLLFGGFLRLVTVYHATFSINSLAHWVGSQPYSDDSSAKDSWLTAIVTMGEGYHNFHHTFPGDYRNGFRSFDFDPPKWLLLALSAARVVRNLNRTPEHLVALRRLRTDRSRLQAMPLTDENRAQLEHGAANVRSALGGWARATQQEGVSPSPVTTRVRRTQRDQYRTAYKAWVLQVAAAEG